MIVGSASATHALQAAQARQQASLSAVSRANARAKQDGEAAVSAIRAAETPGEPEGDSDRDDGGGRGSTGRLNVIA